VLEIGANGADFSSVPIRSLPIHGNISPRRRYQTAGFRQ
jgi:hypothetical protein